ncbi:MAG: diaminobutyrate acetyltransferase [Gammaproteobacteria bacterium]
MRTPRAEDARRVWELINADTTLEGNSAYCYLLLCTHFAESGLIAESDNEIAGFVMAYRPPSDPEAIFVWQVGVAPAGRGHGLGRRMLDKLIGQPANRDTRYLTATVDPDNAPSNRLFAAFAREQGVALQTEEGYGPELFPPGHPPEPLLRIGPLPVRENTHST